MRHKLFAFAAAALAAAVTGTIGCTATGGTTVIVSGVDGGDEGGSTNPFETDGGTSTTKDSGTPTNGDYDALFGPPANSSTTPGSLFGLWAGKDFNSHDMRIQFSKSQILVALKCGSGSAVGGTIAASVSSSSIRTLESKTIGSASCYLAVSPDELPNCTSGSSPCFTITGSKLDLYTLFNVSGELTKLSD